VCVIAQGSKEVLLGESRYRYDPSQYLLATVELPRVSQVLEASKERPYLSLRLELAPTVVSSVMVEAGHASPRDHADVRAIDVSPLQFQKRLRLQEARRLMLGEDLDAASAAYRVGYQDASHFNREYKSQIARPTDARRATAAGRGSRFPSPMGQKAHPAHLPPSTDHYPICADSVGLVFFIGTSRKTKRITRLHDLRPSTATLLLTLGVHPKIVQELLGHSQIFVTLDILAASREEAVFPLPHSGDVSNCTKAR
jgi:integrase